MTIASNTDAYETFDPSPCMYPICVSLRCNGCSAPFSPMPKPWRGCNGGKELNAMGMLDFSVEFGMAGMVKCLSVALPLPID